MASVHTFQAVELNKTQLKKIEKIFIAAKVPYFTHGVLSYDNFNPEHFSKSITAGKFVIDAAGIIGHIKDNNLVQAIKTEFSGVDLVAWFKANQVHQNQLLKPQP